MKKKYILGILLVSLMLFAGCGKEEALETSKEETLEVVEAEKHVAENEPENKSEDKKYSEIQFPIILEDGKIEIESLFPFEGFNPDAGNQTGNDIASISVKNLSGTYLEEAKISIWLNEETEVKFIVTDLPAETSAMAFSIENKTLGDEISCSNVSCEARFTDEIKGIPEQISVQEDGTQVSVTNLSGQDLSRITVYCRCPFDEEYFGGMAYQYELQGLAAGQTKVIHAEELLLGIVEVVRVDVE